MPMMSAPRAPPRRDCRPASTRNQYLRRFDDVQQGRRLHPDSRHTERSSGEWVVPLVRFHGRRSREDLCPTEPTIESLLTDLAVHGHVTAACHNQALSALLGLSREGLRHPLGRPIDAIQTRTLTRVPPVLTTGEALKVMRCVPASEACMAT
jgi:hypothetical protein